MITAEGMESSVTCSLCSVCERDMDILFMQAVLTDSDFLQVFLQKTTWRNKNLTAIHAELSNVELDLGETDITVILTDGTDRYALLIEDKIDAIAQPEQHQRYVKRGNKAIERGDYTEYAVFIVCPQKYYDANKEARKYEHFVSYEECAQYFEHKDDAISNIRYQGIMQALDKAKKPSQVTVKEEANTFFKQYCKYQHDHFPMLDIRTKETNNGYWVEYRTSFPYSKVTLFHKLPNGYVDLTFKRKHDKHDLTELISDWLNEHGYPEVCAQPTGESMVLRINVPNLYYKKGFSNIPSADVDRCFEALVKLCEIAKFMQSIQKFLSKDS